jgi:hypothetical protein
MLDHALTAPLQAHRHERGLTPTGEEKAMTVSTHSRPIWPVLALLAVLSLSQGAPRSEGAAAATGARESAAQSKRFGYDIRVTYTISRETVEAATGLRTSVERRIDAAYEGWVSVSSTQVFVYSAKGDYVSGPAKAAATVRDERVSPACAQTAEASDDLRLKFVTNRSPLSAVYLDWSRSSTLPKVGCGAADIEGWETGARGKGDWSRISPASAWYESRTKFYGDVYAKLAAGHDGVLQLTFASPRQQAGVTERAVIRVDFTRKADREPKPSAKSVVIKGPTTPIIGTGSASMWFVVWRGGEATGMSQSKSKCTGSFVNGRGRIERSQLDAIFQVVVTARILGVAKRLGGDSLVRLIKPYTGKRVALIRCLYLLAGDGTPCKWPFRGALELVVDQTRKVTKGFSFAWTELNPHHPC